ncbi:hypothetical protein ACFL54_06815 [Planctomycetota bacterium]
MLNIKTVYDSRTPHPACPPGRDPRNGIVLIVVLGTLALMSILALTFVSMMRLERSISANYVDRTRAVFTAESGIEAAVAHLAQFSGGVLSADEFKRMQYNPDDPYGSLAAASKLSFMSPEPGPAGEPVSGNVGHTHTAGGDYYLLKVEDESGKLNLNDSNELMDPGQPASGRLFKIISNLGQILFSNKGAGIGTAIAAAIIAERQNLGGRFSILRQVEDALVNSLVDFSPGERQLFLSNVTLWSWQDPDVIKPIPAWGTYDDAKTLYGNPPDDGFPRYGFPFMRWEEVQSFNDGDDTNGIHDRGYKLEPRCPVNVNTASKELIQALLAGLEGWTVFEGPGENYEKSFMYFRIDKYDYDNDRHLGDWMGSLYYGYWLALPLTGKYGVNFYSNYRYENTPRSSELMHAIADKIILDANTTDRTYDFKRYTLPYARLRLTRIPDLDPNNDDGDPSFSAGLANDLYDRIRGLGIYTGNPNPIENWREFKFYLDTVIQRAKTGELPELAIDDPFAADETEGTWTYDREGDFQYFNEYYRDLILANFDPNTMSNDFNPDLVVYRHTDKADLITYTTEFCFEPTGTFSIQAQGAIVGGAQYELKAQADVTAVVKLFEFKRLSTQAQLVGNDTSIAVLGEQFGRNESADVTKWGDVVGYDNGARLVSHPEPIAESLPDKFEFVTNGIFDGRIGLSPIKHNPDGILDGIATSVVLSSYFEGSMDAMNPAGTVPPGLPSETDTYLKYQIDNSYYDAILAGFDVAEELRESENPLMSAHTRDNANRKPGTLFVDGVFSEAWKCPSYPLSANGVSHLSMDAPLFSYLYTYPHIEGGRQTLLLALKPGFLMKDSNRCRNFLNMGQGAFFNDPLIGTILSLSRLQFSYPQAASWWPPPPAGQRKHAIIFGSGTGGSCWATGYYFPRTNFVGTDEDPTRKYLSYGRDAYHFEGRRWNMIAVTWMFQDNLAHISVNGRQPNPSFRNSLLTHAATLAVPYTIIREIDWSTRMDITPADAPRPFLAPIRLGAFARSQGCSWNLYEPADSTYGEFIFYNDGIIDQDIFARTDDFFWDEGFYYHDPGNPATYCTPEINLGAKPGKPITIRSISWTGRWPQYVMAADINEDSTPDPVWGTAEYIDYFQQTVGEDMPLWLENMSSKDDPETWDLFTVDIFANDNWLYAGSDPSCWNLTPPETSLSYSGGSIPVDVNGYKLKTDENIQLKFYFNLADDQVEPLRESPYLDDITITYETGTKILFYQMH